MNHLRIAALLLLTAALTACTPRRQDTPTSVTSPYVRVQDGEFYVGDSLYRYVGTNFWYGPILASTGRGGDRERLMRELDAMQAIGIDNLRILVGGDGREGLPSHIAPVLQTAPGVYNDTLLDGLDYLMAELEHRHMRAVLYLNNAWEWSGGYGSYLEWAGAGEAPIPSLDGWPEYMAFVSQFVHNERAIGLALDHVRSIVTRTNRYTHRPYAESPAIMAWQVANEPRAFLTYADSPSPNCGQPADSCKVALLRYIDRTAQLIHSLDSNHLVSTGTEGKHGCEQDIDLFTAIHALPSVDYANIHIWPYNWGWVTPETLVDSIDVACRRTAEYIDLHYERMHPLGKPITLEEFGYPRDGFVFTPGSPTCGRDAYYDYVFSIVAGSGQIAGANFWGWGGEARPTHVSWQAGDDYCGDPAQEEQGLNSVFAVDTSLLRVVSEVNEKIHADR